MKIDVRVRDLDESADLRARTVRRIEAHLRRFGHEVTRVVARLQDVNGPRGGQDKHWQVTVEGRRVGTVTVAHLGDDAGSALDRALARAGHTLRRGLRRVASPARRRGVVSRHDLGFGRAGR